MMFFDDGSAGASSFDRAVEVADVLQGTLDKAGWKVNVGKSRWVPSQRPSILGFELELVNPLHAGALAQGLAEHFHGICMFAKISSEDDVLSSCRSWLL